MFENNNQNTYAPSNTAGMEPTFFGKVMSFFALAILSSAVGTYVAMAYFMDFFFANPWVTFTLYAVELGIIFTAKYWAQKRPINRVLFAVFTFISGVTIAPLISIVMATPEGTAILMKALFATAFMFIATAMIGWNTKKDLSGMGKFLMMSLIGMIVVAVIGIFVPWGNTFEMIYSGIGVLLFAGFTAYDMQKLKHYPQDRYIEAAINLYLDIFNLFLFILRFMLALAGRD